MYYRLIQIDFTFPLLIALVGLGFIGINNELVIKIKKLIEDNNRDKLLSSLADIHYADLAEIFELLETTEVIFLVKMIQMMQQMLFLN
jgi:Mg/Co/Ni transporter MgtE